MPLRKENVGKWRVGGFSAPRESGCTYFAHSKRNVFARVLFFFVALPGENDRCRTRPKGRESSRFWTPFHSQPQRRWLCWPLGTASAATSASASSSRAALHRAACCRCTCDRVCNRDLCDVWRNSWPRKESDAKLSAHTTARESKVWNYENENIRIVLRLVNWVRNPKTAKVRVYL